MSDWESEEMRRSRPFIIGARVGGTATGRPLLLPLPLRRATRVTIIGGWKTGIVLRSIMSFRAHASTVWWAESCRWSHVAEVATYSGWA
jgi:hypothetical protein